MRVSLGMRDHLVVTPTCWLFSALESMCHKHPGPHSVLCQMEGMTIPAVTVDEAKPEI